MRSLKYWSFYALALGWLLLMSVAGVLLIPIFFRSPRFNRVMARFGTWGISGITGIRIQLDGASSLESFQPCIYIGNHQDNFDVHIFGSIFPLNTIVIGKRELIWIPFFNLFYYAAGNIFIDRKRHRRAIEGISDAGRKIRDRGVSVMIFPEGTRNKTGHGLLPFKKGAFHLAIESGLPVVPLVAAPLRDFLDHRDRRISAGILRVRVLDPIPTVGMTSNDVHRLAELSRATMLQALEGFSSAHSTG